MVVTVVGKYGEVRANLTTGDYSWTRKGGSSSGNAPLAQPNGSVGIMESVEVFLIAIQGGGQTKSYWKSYERVQSYDVST